MWRAGQIIGQNMRFSLYKGQEWSIFFNNKDQKCNFPEVRDNSSRMMYRGRWGAPGSLRGGGGRMGLQNGAAKGNFHANLRAQDRCFQAHNSSNSGIAGGPWAGVRPRAPIHWCGAAAGGVGWLLTRGRRTGQISEIAPPLKSPRCFEN